MLARGTLKVDNECPEGMEYTEQRVKTKKRWYQREQFDWHVIGRMGSLSSAFRFVIIIVLFIFPLVFVAVIKEIRRCRERSSPSAGDIAEFELCLIDDSGSGFDVNPLRW